MLKNPPLVRVEAPSQYRDFAETCDRLARQVESPKGVPPSRGIDDANARHLRYRLLRAHRERPGGGRTAAKQDDEIAPSYT